MAPPIAQRIILATAPGRPSAAPPMAAPKPAPTTAPTVVIVMCSLASIIVPSFARLWPHARRIVNVAPVCPSASAPIARRSRRARGYPQNTAHSFINSRLLSNKSLRRYAASTLFATTCGARRPRALSMRKLASSERGRGSTQGVYSGESESYIAIRFCRKFLRWPR